MNDPSFDEIKYTWPAGTSVIWGGSIITRIDKKQAY